MSYLGGKRGFLSSPATTFIASGDWRHQCPSGIHCWRQKTVTFCRLIAILRNNARTRAIETTDKIPSEIFLTPLPLPLNSGCIEIFDKHDEIAQIWSLMQKDGEVIVGWNLIMLRVHWHFHRCYSKTVASHSILMPLTVARSLLWLSLWLLLFLLLLKLMHPTLSWCHWQWPGPFTLVTFFIVSVSVGVATS